MPHDFQIVRERKARKPHRCECCEGWIPRGEVYYRVFGVYEGSTYSMAAHRDCHAAYWKLLEIIGCANEELSSGYYADELRHMSAWEAQGTIDALRGHFPHVACRLEYRLRHWLDSAASRAFCGFTFYVEDLGPHGCPNCLGEGLE